MGSKACLLGCTKRRAYCNLLCEVHAKAEVQSHRLRKVFRIGLPELERLSKYIIKSVVVLVRLVPFSLSLSNFMVRDTELYVRICIEYWTIRSTRDRRTAVGQPLFSLPLRRTTRGAGRSA